MSGLLRCIAMLRKTDPPEMPKPPTKCPCQSPKHVVLAQHHAPDHKHQTMKPKPYLKAPGAYPIIGSSLLIAPWKPTIQFRLALAQTNMEPHVVHLKEEGLGFRVAVRDLKISCHNTGYIANNMAPFLQ